MESSSKSAGNKNFSDINKKIRLLIPEGYKFVSPDQILQFTIKKRNIAVHYTDGTEDILCASSLLELETLLSDKFLRIGRYNIINIQHVHLVNTKTNQILLQYKEHSINITISNTGKKKILSLMSSP